MAAAKELVAAVAHRPIDDSLLGDVAQRIALQRASAEGREGVAAFLDKRPPAWIRD
jgi:methylglutaconyl-CoA hydratase